MGERTSYRRLNPKDREAHLQEEEKVPTWRKVKQGRNREDTDEKEYD